jgi:hypothetical protein
LSRASIDLSNPSRLPAPVSGSRSARGADRASTFSPHCPPGREAGSARVGTSIKQDLALGPAARGDPLKPGLPTFTVIEGGYNVAALGRNLAAFLTGLESA